MVYIEMYGSVQRCIFLHKRTIIWVTDSLYVGYVRIHKIPRFKVLGPVEEAHQERPYNVERSRPEKESQKNVSRFEELQLF